MTIHPHYLHLKTHSSLLLTLEPPLKLQQWQLRAPPKSNHLFVKLCRSTKWDSNAESFRNQNFKNKKDGKRKYYYDADGDEEEDDDDGYDLEGGGQWGAVLEEYIDSIWIFKVIGSYGWFSPIIMLSILLASGLKAFLMALALPLGQSTISFLFQKIWSSKDYKSRRKMKSKRKAGARGSRTFTGRRARKEKKGYPSWVSARDVSADEGSDKDSSFGGWDELDRGRRDFIGGSSSSAPDPRAGKSQHRPSVKKNFTRLERRSDSPLLLRLLIAVFPFLGWWTKMF